MDDPARVFRGRVVDAEGTPLRLAVIEPFALEADWRGRGAASTYGAIDGLEAMGLPQETVQNTYDEAGIPGVTHIINS